MSRSLKASFKAPGRLGTLRAMAALTGAHVLVAAVPFGHWRRTLGSARGSQGIQLNLATKLARQVERAAERLPFQTKCLPRALALSWILRAKGIPHTVVLAARPARMRDAPDALHAWVDVAGVKVIGDLPGPWIETLRRGA